MQMTKLISTAALAVVMLGAAGLARHAMAQSSGEAFNVDATHSSVMFRIKHLGVSYFYGAFWGPDGSYALNFEDPSASSMKISINSANVATGSEGRDDHVKGADFFNVEQYPTITFEATSFETVGEGQMRIEGNLTMIGQTHPVTAMLEFVGEGDTGRQGFKSGFEAQFEFKRSEWGMDQFVGVGGLGDEISVYVGIEGKRAEE